MAKNQKSTAARGYGNAHQRLRAKVKKLVEAGGGVCWRCGLPIRPDEPFDLGHDDVDRTVYRGPEHVRCNRATSGRAKRKAAAPRRWELATRTSRNRRCEICGADYRASYAEQRTCGRACGRELQRRNAPPSAKRMRPPSGEQLTWAICEGCGALGTSKACSSDCFRIRMRNRYRLRVGIPLDAPLWKRAA